jgi:glycosyltransferase involved in cell wall biosynthesis
MRIAIISYGHVDSITELALSLTRLGNEVRLYMFVYGDRFINSTIDWDLKNIPFGVSDVKALQGTSPETDLYLSYISGPLEYKIFRTPNISLKSFANIPYLRKCTAEIREWGAEVVHFNGTSALQWHLYYMLYRVPKVYTIHDFFQHSGSESRLRNILNKIHTKLKYEFIQHSAFLKKEMVQFSGIADDRVHVVYYPPFRYYDLYKTEQPSERQPVITFFGRIERYKGLRYLCEALPLITKRIPDIRCNILGRGHVEFDIAPYLGKYNVNFDNTRITNQQLSNYLTDSSLVVVPYTDATQSGVVITAFCFDKPVVASKVGGIPELVEDGLTGSLIEPRNPAAIADAICNLLGDENLYASMVKNIKAAKMDPASHTMNWEVAAADTLAVYTQARKRFV